MNPPHLFVPIRVGCTVPPKDALPETDTATIELLGEVGVDSTLSSHLLAALSYASTNKSSQAVSCNWIKFYRRYLGAFRGLLVVDGIVMK